MIYTLAIIFSVVFMLSIIILVRNNKLEEKYSLLWLIFGIGIIILSIFPNIIDKLAKYFNIQKSDLIENKDDINKNLTELTEKNNETIPQIRVIQRAMTNVDENKRNEMLALLKTSFKDIFNEEDDDN